MIASIGVSEAKTHVVNPGETLTSIAQAERLSPETIAELNQLESAADLRPGQVIALDRESTDTLPVPKAAIEAAKARLAAADVAAQPRAGADLAMWDAQAATVKPAALKTAASGPLHRFAAHIAARTSAIASSLTRSALRFIGVPYVFGGTSSNGFDCSGYVQHVFALLGRHLPRTADAQYAAGRSIDGTMIAGDLVFFQTYERGPSHVGIYLGDGKFVHASSSHGVTVSALSEGYWRARYLGAKRVTAQ
jgi:cell wall-associated NlpC family hydrolase